MHERKGTRDALKHMPGEVLGYSVSLRLILEDSILEAAVIAVLQDESASRWAPLMLLELVDVVRPSSSLNKLERFQFLGSSGSIEAVSTDSLLNE